MKSSHYRTILVAGLVAGVLDLAAAFVVIGLRGRSPFVVLQSIAGGLLGSEAYKGGIPTAALGGVLHFIIALGWAALFYGISTRLRLIRSAPLVSGFLYGIFVYACMNLIVLPISQFPHPIQLTLIGVSIIILCVGLPISFITARRWRGASDTP